MALRGNGTLRADPRVSSSAVDGCARFFLYFSTLSNERSRSRDSFARARGSSKGTLKGNASSLTGGRRRVVGGGFELEEPRSPSYEKNSQMLSTHIINQAYTSERHASAASLKIVTSSLAKNYYAL